MHSAVDAVSNAVSSKMANAKGGSNVGGGGGDVEHSASFPYPSTKLYTGVNAQALRTKPPVLEGFLMKRYTRRVVGSGKCLMEYMEMREKKKAGVRLFFSDPTIRS